MIINDSWGTIVVEPKYEKILESKEFKELKNKLQLGLSCNPNAVHNRYQHSIGVYYLACKLVDICKEKFSDILNINQEDEEAIKIMALVHDIGHGCFSHVSEYFLEGSHEQRTVKLLIDEHSEIHQVIVNNFGNNVLEKVISLIELKEKIKNHKDEKVENNLLLIVSKLLSGGIDIDRIDYLYRDSKYIFGTSNDFSEILQHIDLEYIDDSLEIVFDESAEFMIANFFNKRFELYDTLYLENKTKILEAIFGQFMKEINFEITWDTTEAQMNNLFMQYLNSDDPIIARYANLLTTKLIDKNILYKEINNKEQYHSFKQRMASKVEALEKYPECVLETYHNINIYNEDNKILINKDGLTIDISDCSKILSSELSKDKYVYAIDLELLGSLMLRDKVDKKVMKKTLNAVKKAMAAEIEQEKKYIFSDDIYIKPTDGFKIIKDKLNLQDPEYIENCDIYYDYNNILEAHHINVRKRIVNNQEEWTVKRPLQDKSSISKRIEKNFNNIDEVIRFLQQEWNIPINELQEKITLKTSRIKYEIEYKNGLFELVFDKTTPSYNNTDYTPSYMIECELKSGNSTGLYFINEVLKQFDFIVDCNQSKKEIALSKVKNKTNNIINKDKPSTYEEDLKRFFITNPELLEKLKVLNDKKINVRKLKEKYGALAKPIVVTLSGTPRAGKTTCVDNLFEFLKKSDLKTTCLQEPAGIIYAGLKSKEEKAKLLEDRVGFVEQQYDIGKEYIDNNITKNDILLCDRGVIDTFIWYDMYYQMGMIDEQRYQAYLERLKKNPDYYNYFYALYCDTDEALRRDYLTSLSIEPRTTINRKNIDSFNSSMLRIMPYAEANIDYRELINTTSTGKMDSSYIIANNVLDNVIRMYVRKG